MKVKSFVLAVLAITCPGLASAQVCDIALTSRAFNTVESSISDDIAYAKRTDLCNQTYSSLEEARKSAAQSGFSLVYDSLSIGDDRARRTTSGRYEINQTNFCTSNADDFERAYSSQYREQIATAALQAWTNCIDKNSNRLALQYTVENEGQFFTATIHRGVVTGALEAEVTGISAVGPGASSLVCDIGGQRVRPGRVYNIKLTSTQTAFTCEKSSSGSASIALQTSQDSLPFVNLPSRQSRYHDRWIEMERRMNSLLPTAFAGSVVAFDAGQCPSGWKEYREAAGRVLVGVNAPPPNNADNNGLPTYVLGQNYGSPTITINATQIPAHTHEYSDIFHSEAGGSVQVPNQMGSGRSDTDNAGYQMKRTTASQGSGKPIPVQVPARALLFCTRE